MDSINKAVHDGLVREGIVKNSITVPVLQQKNLTTAEMQDPITWLENVGKVVKQGDNYYKISSVDGCGNVRLLGNEGEKLVKPSERIKQKELV